MINKYFQTGDPTGTGRGGESIFGEVYGQQARQEILGEVYGQQVRQGILSEVYS